MYDKWTGPAVAGMLTSLVLPVVAAAQTVPWDVFADTQSASVCDVVNAANAELVVLKDTGQLVLVTGEDITLESTFVDLDGFVIFEGADAGLIGFREDGDGLRSLWWTTLTGWAVNVDPFTGAPSESSLFPSDFTDVACDACEFWDDQSVCPGDNGEDTPSPFTFNLCGVGSQLSLALTAVGLTLMSLTRHRQGPPTFGRRRGRPCRSL